MFQLIRIPLVFIISIMSLWIILYLLHQNIKFRIGFSPQFPSHVAPFIDSEFT